MKAIMPTLLPDVAALRKRNGSDRWDEMWEGVLHMPPAPNLHHQRLEFHIEAFLNLHWIPVSGGEVYHQVNVAGPGVWTENFRVPDLVCLSPDRFDRKNEDYITGGPNVVIEIHSPGDEAYQKLDFYAQIGVREAWIIDRDTKEPEIYFFDGTELKLQPPNSDGWHPSAVTGFEMRADGQGKLRIRRGDDPGTEKSLPE
jgi:Uma2 family endonuclease